MSPSKHIVEIFDVTENDFIRHSYHKNIDYALIQCHVAENNGKTARIIKDGKIIYHSEVK